MARTMTVMVFSACCLALGLGCAHAPAPPQARPALAPTTKPASVADTLHEVGGSAQPDNGKRVFIADFCAVFAPNGEAQVTLMVSSKPEDGSVEVTPLPMDEAWAHRMRIMVKDFVSLHHEPLDRPQIFCTEK